MVFVFVEVKFHCRAPEDGYYSFTFTTREYEDGHLNASIQRISGSNPNDITDLCLAAGGDDNWQSGSCSVSNIHFNKYVYWSIFMIQTFIKGTPGWSLMYYVTDIRKPHLFCTGAFSLTNYMQNIHTPFWCDFVVLFGCNMGHSANMWPCISSVKIIEHFYINITVPEGPQVVPLKLKTESTISTVEGLKTIQ